MPSHGPRSTRTLAPKIQTQPSGNFFSLKAKNARQIATSVVHFAAELARMHKMFVQKQMPTRGPPWKNKSQNCRQVAELRQQAGGSVTNTMFAETFYYLTIPLMIIIHAGFLPMRWAHRAQERSVVGCEKHSGLRLYDPNILLLWLVGLLGLPNGYYRCTGSSRHFGR